MQKQLREMTKYFRDSIAANISLDFKNENYGELLFEDFLVGKLPQQVLNRFNLKGKDSSQKTDVIIVAKTFATIFDGQAQVNSHIESMTGVYFIPAALSNNGELFKPETKMPWIAREYLRPIIESDLAIGDLNNYDLFLEENLYKFQQSQSWADYVNLCEQLYEQTTNAPFSDLTVNGMEYMPQMFLFEDTSVQATINILKLYNDLLTMEEKSFPLYENFMNNRFHSIQPLKPLEEQFSKKHSGQMGGHYGLSPSQRECMLHFNEMENGEILAINGPPGTGKTTLIQSLVANMLVEAAYKKQPAPIIVAASTNNQAVTNIIESFGKIDAIQPNELLERRWIEGVKSFAVYFPSKAKEKVGREKGFHVTNATGQGFFDEVESEQNIAQSKKKFMQNVQKYFARQFNNLDESQYYIHEKLCETIDKKDALLTLYHQYFAKFGEGQSIQANIKGVTEKIEQLLQQLDILQARLKEWHLFKESIPWYYRLLQFLKAIQTKIQQRIDVFMNVDETFIEPGTSLDQIFGMYTEKITAIRKSVQENQELLTDLESARMQEKRLFPIAKQSKEINTLLDAEELIDVTYRYELYWLAVHYFECRWLLSKRLTENQKGRTFDNVLRQRFHNLSMVTPCYVMTFYQLAKQFSVFNGPEKYLYNNIDLLIVDEAGQVSPEIAACSFSLAKKAVVVGDVNQIEPVWNIHRSLDLSLAMAANVIHHPNEFEKLIELGLNTSESSVMRVAGKSTTTRKFGNRWLFLSEHRRCYNEIINYCNELIYQGQLEPMRGFGDSDKDSVLKNSRIPYMGHYQIDSEKSEKRNGSRHNKLEAQQVVSWVEKNFDTLKQMYQAQGEKEKEILGIITPFKAQVQIIKKLLPKNLKEVVEVGTVHTFQGGERKMIILSTVYGATDGCFFIDNKKSLMNVAVSRAKDSFLIFGDVNCLSTLSDTSSGLLRKHVRNFNGEIFDNNER